MALILDRSVHTQSSDRQSCMSGMVNRLFDVMFPSFYSFIYYYATKAATEIHAAYKKQYTLQWSNGRWSQSVKQMRDSQLYNVRAIHNQYA